MRKIIFKNILEIYSSCNRFAIHVYYVCIFIAYVALYYQLRHLLQWDSITHTCNYIFDTLLYKIDFVRSK